MGRHVATLVLLIAVLAPTAAGGPAPRNGRIMFSEPGKLRSMRADGSDRRLVADSWFRSFEPAPGDGLVSPGSERLDLFHASDGSAAGSVPLPGKLFVGEASFAPNGK